MKRKGSRIRRKIMLLVSMIMENSWLRFVLKVMLLKLSVDIIVKI